ncbi:lantibiotic dehydratase [Pontibacter silvestris]|uniref:Lantibiotic dehydratase n=1 Tax=Pontibacter silvestris TaxID=2305183 RepID=A0ABW4X4A4_9BACT|nr:lantibiotic dehydratase [Pontibacter silvestris]MCC9138804.1 lantibiotic dehydratase [Pontibacter silvestris]
MLLLRTPAYTPTAYADTDISMQMKNPYFLAAVMLASPTLYQSIQANDFCYRSLPPKAKLSVRKYLNRMCYRATPFGLFSGISLVSWSSKGKNNIIVDEADVQVKLELSFSAELTVAASLLAEELASYHVYQTNPSSYQVQDEYRYLRFEKDEKRKRRIFMIDSLQRDKLLHSLLLFCNSGQPKKSIIAFVMKQVSASSAESEAFVDELIAEQILLSKLKANITGEDFLQRLLSLGKKEVVHSPKLRHLRSLLEMLHDLDGVGRTVDPWLLEKFSEQLLYSFPLANTSFYANMYRNVRSGYLNSSYQEQVLEALTCLRRLTQPRQEPAGLIAFRKDYMKKFEGRVVPLLMALDPEVGVGYEGLAISQQAPKLLQGIHFEAAEEKSQRVDWTPAHVLLMDKWQEAGRGSAPIQLTAQDILTLPADNKGGSMPPSTSVLFRVLGEDVYIEQAGGISATALLGRFTHFHEEINTFAKAVAQEEQQKNPHVVFAEIAHLCDEHTANIDRRATVYSYEIPLLVQSTLPMEQQIKLSELWVKVEGNRIVLWSERLQKIIVPRLSSAFNFVRDDLAVFRFLCDLQYQGLQSNFTLNMSRFFPDIHFYPRVVYKSTILHLATWYLRKEQIEPILSADGEEQVSQVKELSKKMGWPRYIALTQHDHQLVFNLERETEVRFFLNSIKNKESLMIKEFPFAEEQEQPVVSSAQGAYVHQFLAAVCNKREVYHEQKIPTSPELQSQIKKRKFLPGGEWLYFKIYLHPSRANAVLTEILLPLLQRVVKEQKVIQWYFIRYRDPDYHLRVRLCLSVDGGGTSTILSLMHQKLTSLVRKGVISNLKLAVYERELERYGSARIEAVERVFCTSSELLAAYIKKAPFSEEDYAFYAIAFAGVEEILNAFRLNLKDKHQLLCHIFESFFREFGERRELKVQLSFKYREMCKLVGLFPATDDVDLFTTLRIGKLNGRFRLALQHLADSTKSVPQAKRAQLLSDMIHMHLNRLFIDQPRQQELVVYYCLYKHYQSLVARQQL